VTFISGNTKQLSQLEIQLMSQESTI